MKARYKNGQECLLFLPHAPEKVPVTVLGHQVTKEGIVYRVDFGYEVLPGIKHITTVDEWQLSPVNSQSKGNSPSPKSKIQMAATKPKKQKPSKKPAANKKPATSKAKNRRVKLPPAQAEQARQMLRQIRDWYDEAKSGKKPSKQRSLVFNP